MANKTNASSFKIEQLSEELYDMAILFLESVFLKEQHIPKALIPVTYDHQKWWCIRARENIVGTAAAWKCESEWHWGRLAVHKDLRGLGLGKKLVLQSLDELFQLGVENVKIEARDHTVQMLFKIGGKITGQRVDFYGYPITPMEIQKTDFIQGTLRRE